MRRAERELRVISVDACNENDFFGLDEEEGIAFLQQLSLFYELREEAPGEQ